VSADTLTMFDIEKPTYSVPSMSEIAKRDNGLTAVSTFSGAGGSSIGLRQAGWRIPYAVEFIDSARDTYSANAPSTFVDSRDIRTIQASDILDRLGLRPGDLDLFEGSPPCSSFSSANTVKSTRIGNAKVKDYSDGVQQQTDDLFDEWLRLVEGLRPRAILAENVPGMLQLDDAVPMLRHVTDTLDSLGYRLNVAIRSSMHYGSATARKRLIFMGVRRDVLADRALPDPARLPVGFTLRDALDSLPVESPADEIEHAAKVAPSHRKEWEKIRPGESSDFIFQVTRCSWDAPMPTITVRGSVGGADPLHPDVCRKFTPTEVKWATGFPADFVLTGKPSQRYERIARAVPPPIYRAHGEVLARLLGGSL
jgi:DNA (cytosine-5)-methyltransferase 1